MKEFEQEIMQEIKVMETKMGYEEEKEEKDHNKYIVKKNLKDLDR